MGQQQTLRGNRGRKRKMVRKKGDEGTDKSGREGEKIEKGGQFARSMLLFSRVSVIRLDHEMFLPS